VFLSLLWVSVTECDIFMLVMSDPLAISGERIRHVARRFCGESSLHFSVMSLGWFPSCGLVVVAGEGSAISQVGHVLSVRGSCVHVGISMVNMHAQQIRARVTRQFGGRKLFLFVYLFIVLCGFKSFAPVRVSMV